MPRQDPEDARPGPGPSAPGRRSHGRGPGETQPSDAADPSGLPGADPGPSDPGPSGAGFGLMPRSTALPDAARRLPMLGALLREARRAHGPAALSPELQVLTAEGPRAAGSLHPGLRIVTRSGLVALKGITLIQAPATLLRLPAWHLGIGRPRQAMLLAPASGIVLRGWRAAALYGRDPVVVPVSRLVDGLGGLDRDPRGVGRLPAEGRLLVQLDFERPQVFRAEGVELVSDAVLADPD